MAFDAFLPFFLVFASEGEGVFKADDLDLLDPLPNDEATIGDGGVNIDSVYGSPVEHRDDPFPLILVGEGGDARAGSFAKSEGGAVGPIFRREVLKGGDFSIKSDGCFLEEAFLIPHLEGEDHFWAI